MRLAWDRKIPIARPGRSPFGKRADLVLIDGDPTNDITAIRKTDRVICRGAIYESAVLGTRSACTGAEGASACGARLHPA